MYCSNCGQKIDNDSRFCRYCGASQEVEAPASDRPAPITPAIPAASPPTPVSSIGRTIGIAAAALLGLLVIGSVVGGSNGTTGNANTPDALADNLGMQADNMEADSLTKPEPGDATRSAWVYSSDVDKVRGGTSYFASTTSTNTIHQDPPYDSDTSMRMTVRRMPSSGTDVVLTISSGQLMCPSYEGCTGTVRFDNDPAQRVRFNGPADNSSDTIFVVGAKSFVGKLKRAKKVIVEKTLYEAVNPQFEFDVSGLKWEY